MNRTFRALGTCVSVLVDGDVPGLDVIRMLLEAYPDVTEPPQLAFELRGGAAPTLVCAGRYETPVQHAEDLVPLFELDLYHALVEHAPPGWLLHAAALEHDGEALVFAGESGAGKTTLSLALIARGWRLVTEEIVLVAEDSSVSGLARPLHGAVEVPAGWTSGAYSMRSPQGRVERTIVQPPQSVRVTEPIPLRAVVRIGHGPNVRTRLARIPATAALQSLWGCTLRSDDGGLTVATSILSAHEAYELASSSVAEALAAVESVFAGNKLAES